MKAPVKIKKKKAPNKYPWPLNQKKVEKAITQLYRDFDSYRRLGGFMDMLECGELTPPEAMIVLGETWTTFDNLRNFPQLQEYLEAILEQSSDALRLMMTAKELKTHDKLPETLTVYRGCYNTNDDGISYSLDRDVATSFPGLNRYRMARKRRRCPAHS